ncbi:hypothetical protein [Natronobiforma cellulositropha]|uniref:hypothetical protein n=1 Tax=Natronobiforma cellulositropha TaxID=1679076 RepID=UPI0021D5E0BD|nr:hypothetical protein [Natronobiforma cellulositropha]
MRVLERHARDSPPEPSSDECPLPSYTVLEGWSVERADDDAVKLTADEAPPRTALAYATSWADFPLFGRQVSVRRRWRVELVRTDCHRVVFREDCDSRDDALETLETLLEL